MLKPEELNRYQRHIQIPEIGIEGQEKIKNSRVLVIGAGGLGCPVLLYLTASGVGTIGIVDFDIVEESNLHRQVIYTTDDIGKFKTDCAVEKLLKQNPFLTFVKHSVQITNQNAIDIINDYDIIIDGTDNFATRYLINDACVLLDKHLVYGSVFNFEGQVSIFNYGLNGPTYRCLFPEPPVPGTIPDCSETGVLGVLPGIIGILQATETIKLITGIGQVLSGKLLMVNALNMQFHTMGFERNPHIMNIMPSTIEGFKKYDYDIFCGTGNKETANEIDITELANLLAKERSAIQLVDVREVNEQPVIEILCETQVPLAKLNEDEIKIDKRKKVILYCKSGTRSRMAVQLLQQKPGFSNVYSLKGGIDAWLKKYNS